MTLMVIALWALAVGYACLAAWHGRDGPWPRPNWWRAGRVTGVEPGARPATDSDRAGAYRCELERELVASLLDRSLDQAGYRSAMAELARMDAGRTLSRRPPGGSGAGRGVEPRM